MGLDMTDGRAESTSFAKMFIKEMFAWFRSKKAKNVSFETDTNMIKCW
jgi:hypothetical protein